VRGGEVLHWKWESGACFLDLVTGLWQPLLIGVKEIPPTGKTWVRAVNIQAIYITKGNVDYLFVYIVKINITRTNRDVGF